MCQQSLLNYLETNTKIKRKDLEKFVLEGDNYLELTKLYESKKIEAESDWTLPKSIKQNYELLDKLLTDIKVVDPAVGSGAFPMGMMNEIVKLRQILSIYFSENKQKTRTDYNLKQSTIENCIYGVDIMPSAIEICKLRFWLSLVIDEEGTKIEPLPNLENKLRVGNSLLEEFEGVKLFDERLLGRDTKVEYKQSTLNEILKYRIKKSEEKLRELKKLHKQFFNEEDNREKNKLRNSIDRLEWELIEETLKEENNEGAIEKLNDIKKSKSKPFFLWKLYFAEVFQRENPGFDVVIGNPPYVGQKGNNNIFQLVKNSDLGRRFHQRRMDYFYFFFHQAINVTRANGNITFITTNYYITATYADILREDFKNRTAISEFVNFNELGIFETARGQHNLITFLTKTERDIPLNVISTSKKGFADSKIINDILYKRDLDTSYFKIPNQNFYDGKLNYIRLQNKYSTKLNIEIVLDKIKEQGIILGKLCNITQGIVTGADKLSNKHIKEYDINRDKREGIFVLSESEVKNLDLNTTESSYLKPWYKNSDIKRWKTNENTNESLIYYTSKSNNSIGKNLLSHFKKYKPLLINRNTRSGTQKVTPEDYDKFVKGDFPISYVMVASAFQKGKYYCVSYARDTGVDYFDVPKIVAPQRSKKNTFGYNECDWYASADVYFIVKKEKDIRLKYVLSLLNSKLYFHWLLHRGKVKGDMFELYLIPLSEIPIKQISPEQQKPFIQLVDQILSITKDEDYLKNPDKKAKVKRLEKEIDQLVYKLYNLTPKEIDIVNSNK